MNREVTLISTETNKTIGCPICNSLGEANTVKNHLQNWSSSEEKCPACGKNCGKPALLDLFCGAGGATRGYQLAGFCVFGVDIKPQPHYIGCNFHQADALEYCAEHGREFDVIHASPPCQGYSRLRHLPWLKDKVYPMLIPATREELQKTGKLWVIENVGDAPLNGAELCGMALGLNFIRHRRFESNILLLFPSCPRHPINEHGAATMATKYRGNGVTGIYKGDNSRIVLGIDWMTLKELKQAIPPAYTEFIGKHLMEVLNGKADRR